MRKNEIVVRRLPLPLRSDGRVLAADPKAVARNTMAMLETHRPGLWSTECSVPLKCRNHGYLIECLLDLPNHHFVLRMEIVKPDGLPGDERFVAAPNFQLEYVDAQGKSWGDVLASIYAVHPPRAVT